MAGLMTCIDTVSSSLRVEWRSARAGRVVKKARTAARLDSTRCEILAALMVASSLRDAAAAAAPPVLGAVS